MRSRGEWAEKRGTAVHRQGELAKLGRTCEVTAGARDSYPGLSQGHVVRQNEDSNPSPVSHHAISKTFEWCGGMCRGGCACTRALTCMGVHMHEEAQD